MIVVTGATGTLGRLIVEELLASTTADQIGVSVRDPGKAGNLADRGVRVRHGDFTDRDSLTTAFEGATQVLIVSSNAAATGGDPLAQHRAAIDAAKSVGVRRIVYTSHMGVSDRSRFPPMRDHAATEEMLAASGVAWTAMRNGFYAATVPRIVGDAVRSGTIAAPADGKVSWTNHADLAAAAARILLDESRFDGPTPPLTGSEALDLSDIAAILSELTGRTIERHVLADEEYGASMTGAGMPSTAVNIMLGLFDASRSGEFTAVDPTLATLLDRPPVTVREVLR